MSLIVNGEKIYPEFIEQEMTVLRPKYQQTFQDQSAGQQEKQLREWAKENVIEKTLLLQTAIKDPRPVEKHIIEMEYKKSVRRFCRGEKFFEQKRVNSKRCWKGKERH